MRVGKAGEGSAGRETLANSNGSEGITKGDILKKLVASSNPRGICGQD